MLFITLQSPLRDDQAERVPTCAADAGDPVFVWTFRRPLTGPRFWGRQIGGSLGANKSKPPHGHDDGLELVEEHYRVPVLWTV